MKWLLFSALAFSIPTYSMQKITDGLPSAPCEECIPPSPDLFRACVPVYTSHLEFLYWTIAEGSLNYALKMRHPAWSEVTPSYAQGRFESGTFGLDPGFRVGLQYFRAPHYWELKLEYTRLTCRGDDHAFKPGATNEYLTGTWPQIIPFPLTRATSHLHFNYNTVDLMADRVFFPNPHLKLRVIGAMTAAWMDQQWVIHYYDTASNNTKIGNRWGFIGGGLKTGSLIDWYWTGNLYMTGMGAFSVYLGKYTNHSIQTTNYQPDPTANPAIPVRDTSYQDVRPTFSVQMVLGPSWQKNYTKARIEIFAGFETNLWFNLQEIYRSTANPAALDKQTWVESSVMALYGLTTRLTIDF